MKHFQIEEGDIKIIKGEEIITTYDARPRGCIRPRINIPGVIGDNISF